MRLATGNFDGRTISVTIDGGKCRLTRKGLRNRFRNLRRRAVTDASASEATDSRQREIATDALPSFKAWLRRAVLT